MKLLRTGRVDEVRHVAPFTGAWIETRLRREEGGIAWGRPLHGGVD